MDVAERTALLTGLSVPLRYDEPLALGRGPDNSIPVGKWGEGRKDRGGAADDIYFPNQTDDDDEDEPAVAAFAFPPSRLYRPQTWPFYK